jgi:hypothetical protein
MKTALRAAEIGHFEYTSLSRQMVALQTKIKTNKTEWWLREESIWV